MQKKPTWRLPVLWYPATGSCLTAMKNYLAVTDGEEFVIDLGSRQSVGAGELVNYNSLWKLDGFTLYASDDNENFTEVLAKTSIDVDENGVVFEALETE